MSSSSAKFKIAAVQASPVFLDREATVGKACRLIAEAGREGARLIVFPESFIPTYPDWVWAVPPGREKILSELYADFLANAVEVPGPVTEQLAEAAQKSGAYLAMGITERDVEASGASLYNTLLYFSPEGKLMGKHRKLVPTGGERIVWAQGDGSTLDAYETPLGKIGGLICWENYMPLARMAMYGKGVDIYLAPTADARDTWQATLRHIACEGRCFVLGCNQFVTKSMYPADVTAVEDLSDQPEIMCRGGSAIVSPLGTVLAGPLYDREGMLTAELDLGEIPRSRFDFDVTGHYARPDVFQLTVNEKPAPPVLFTFEA